MDYIWTTKKGEQLKVDEIDNIYHLRNIVKMLMRTVNDLTDKIRTLKQADDFTLNGEMANEFNDQQRFHDDRSPEQIDNFEDITYNEIYNPDELAD